MSYRYFRLTKQYCKYNHSSSIGQDHFIRFIKSSKRQNTQCLTTPKHAITIAFSPIIVHCINGKYVRAGFPLLITKRCNNKLNSSFATSFLPDIQSIHSNFKAREVMPFYSCEVLNTFSFIVTCSTASSFRVQIIFYSSEPLR